MDIFSHALLPYLIGSTFRLDKKLLAALVLGGIAPDLDFILIGVNYIHPSDFLIVHRGLTHTFFFGFLTVLFVLYIASRGPAKKAIGRFVDFDVGLSLAALALAYAGVLSHLFLDYLTTRGVPLFYPMYSARLSADIFYHTELIIAVASLCIIVHLFKKPYRFDTKKTLIVFIAVLLAVGAIRIEGKEASKSFLGDSNIKSYPSAGLFEWTLLDENGEEFEVYEYNALSRAAKFNSTFPRFNMLGEGAGSGEGDIGAAIEAAEELPQVRVFRWRAYAVAVNASLQDGAWCLEYYDPIVKAETMNSSSLLKLIAGNYATVEVMINGDKATVMKKRPNLSQSL
ncbi:MAG TPA: metal-dependent hydrolase [Methanotrichaceae archaeon]|nr:metal-dependent hydrolase [Methanotrichaceae archaeon]